MNNDTISANIGEWSEFYVFLKLLSDAKLTVVDRTLKNVKGCYYIRGIDFTFKGKHFSYFLNKNKDIVSSESNRRIPNKIIRKYKNILWFLLEDKKRSGNLKLDFSGTFPNLEYETVKNKLTKRDITIKIYDTISAREYELGFSIKSRLGSSPTLLNASNATNFIFCINDISEEKMNYINTKDLEGPYRGKIQNRIHYLYKKGYKLTFEKIQSPIFHQNLILIDSNLPDILANLILYYFKYGYNKKDSTIKSLTEYITKQNPLKYNLNFGHPFYEYKIKRFLVDVALGMVPGVRWNGSFNAGGGFIILIENGDLVCFHNFELNEMQEYLFLNTKLETSSSRRHGFGKIFLENGIYKIKLNLQIRFL